MSTVFQFDPIRDKAWRERFLKRAKTIAKDSAFEVSAAYVGEKVVAPSYSTLKDEIGFAWRRGSESGEFVWQAIEPDANDRVDMGTWGPILGDDVSLAKGSLYQFEDHPNSGDGLLVWADESSALFACFSKQGRLLPLSVSFVEYVELQTSLLGMHGLVELLIDGKNKNLSSEAAAFAKDLSKGRKKRAADFLKRAESVFPDQDLSLLRSKIA